MNELIDSEPELYGADVEEMAKPKKAQSQKERLKSDIQNCLNGQSAAAANEELIDFNEDEISLIDPQEQRQLKKEYDLNQPKFNNSYTGPYPSDPTEFNHTDKGDNYQFTTLTKKR